VIEVKAKVLVIMLCVPLSITVGLCAHSSAENTLSQRAEASSPSQTPADQLLWGNHRGPRQSITRPTQTRSERQTDLNPIRNLRREPDGIQCRKGQVQKSGIN